MNLIEEPFDIRAASTFIAMKKLICITSSLNLTTVLLTTGATMAFSIGIAQAQSKGKPQQKPKYQSRIRPQTAWKTEIEPAAKELISQVVSAYSELNGLSFSVKGVIGDGKDKQEANKVRFAYSRPDGLSVIEEARPDSDHDKQYDYIWNKKSKNFFIISRADDFIMDLNNVENVRKVKYVRYVQSEIDRIPTNYLSYVFLISGLSRIDTVLNLLEKRDVIVFPTVAEGMHITQQIKRLPDTVIDGELMQGVRIRRKSNYGKFLPSDKAFEGEETYWFGVEDHLLRRYQFLSLPQQKNEGGSRFSLQDIKTNPTFPANTFQFVPPTDAVRTDEEGNVMSKKGRN